MKINEDLYVGETGKKIKELPLCIKYKFITGLELAAGSTYQLSLPEHPLFIEPLITSSGSTSGGMFLVLGAGFYYFTNNDIKISSSEFRGIWIKCDNQGLVTISEYRHCGATVSGFRIWYIDI